MEKKNIFWFKNFWDLAIFGVGKVDQKFQQGGPFRAKKEFFFLISFALKHEKKIILAKKNLVGSFLGQGKVDQKFQKFPGLSYFRGRGRWTKNFKILFSFV